ncbi:MAG: GNAT family N-acetyltransferase [Muribaculaceae bacterium]|nr:GNAT family N-acetyltransferase [Muribaculaceae bacterium]
MITLRPVTDINTLIRWRIEVINNVFGEEPSKALIEANRDYYERAVPSGNHLAVIASIEGEDVGCGALCFSEELPSPDNETGRCAYLMNIYVRKPFRKEGVAHTVVRHLVNEAKKRNCKKIYLETTDIARELYSSIGFGEMKDMMKLKSEE